MLYIPRNAFLITLLVSIGALGAAFVAQFVFGLKPCVLCLWQRVPYALLIIDSLMAFILITRVPQLAKPMLLACAMLFVASAGVAFFHIGVEQHWWTLEGGCPIVQLDSTDSEAALKQLLATPQAACDQVAWKLAGVSITWWNTALSVLMAMYLAAVALRKPDPAA